MRAESTKLERWMSILLYVFGLLMITECLRPVKKLTDTDDIVAFILFVFFSLGLLYFRVHWIIRFFLLSAFIYGAVHFYYSSISISSFDWITSDVLDVMTNLSHMFAGKWEMLSNPFRTMLFFLLLWFVTHLIHYFVKVRQNLFLLYLLTIIFISVLDTFTPYDGGKAIIRIILIGFTMLGVLAMLRLSIQERVAFSGGPINKWLFLLSGMVLLSALFGFSAPKFSPKWPDPVPFILSYSDKGGGNDEDSESLEKQVGYDEDDSSLGGPIEPDNTVVFYNTATSGHYWKVENKDIYTGKGWVNFNASENNIQLTDGDLTRLEEFIVPEVLQTENRTTTVYTQERHSHMLHPQSGYLKKIEAKNVNWIQYNKNADKFSLENNIDGKRPVLKDYALTYEMPKYDLAELRKVTEQDETMDILMENNTQLPEGLPRRIYDLANELTKNESNWYDKAKAIENYFDGPEFAYSKEAIAYPGSSQDYVDQFLFETRVGYCDNYSTAMIVLLRAANIPARWIKGYTEGERSIYKGEYAYKVTNNDAHSWVEVYFSGLGWVPFEPTKGFEGQMEFYNSELNTQETEKTESEAKAVAKQNEQQPRERKDTPEKESSSPKGNALWSQKIVWISGGSLILTLGILATFGYVYRRKWLPFIYILRSKKRSGPYFIQAYEILLKQLSRAGITRPDGQTLREYAYYVDAIYETDVMRDMTERYEKMVYRGNLEEGEWDSFRNRWEFLMKKTCS